MTASSFHLADAMTASAKDLNRWLTHLPDPKAKGWGSRPYPLFRALQLEDPELFCKWLEWGCSLFVSQPFRPEVESRYSNGMESSTIVVLMERNNEVLGYLAKHDPQLCVRALEQLMKEEPKLLNNTDCIKLISSLHLPYQDQKQLVSALTLCALARGGADGNALLAFNKGELLPEKGWVSDYMPMGFSYTPGLFKDEVAAYGRINQLDTGLLTAVDVTPLVKLGAVVAAFALKEHLVVNDCVDNLVANRKDFSWQNIRQTLNMSLPVQRSSWVSSNPQFKFSAAQWIEIFDSLCEDIIDLRHIDKNKENVFHFLCHVNLPIEVKIHLGTKAWESRPELLHLADDKRGLQKSFVQLTEHANGDLATLRDTLLALESKAKMDNVLVHQTKKETAAKLKEEPTDAPRRRRM